MDLQKYCLSLLLEKRWLTGAISVCKAPLVFLSATDRIHVFCDTTPDHGHPIISCYYSGLGRLGSCATLIRAGLVDACSFVAGIMACPMPKAIAFVVVMSAGFYFFIPFVPGHLADMRIQTIYRQREGLLQSSADCMSLPIESSGYLRLPLQSDYQSCF